MITAHSRKRGSPGANRATRLGSKDHHLNAAAPTAPQSIGRPACAQHRYRSPISPSRAGPPCQLPGNSNNSDSSPGGPSSKLTPACAYFGNEAWSPRLLQPSRDPAPERRKYRQHCQRVSVRISVWCVVYWNTGSWCRACVPIGGVLMPQNFRTTTTKLATPRTGETGGGYSIHSYTNRVSCDGVTHLLVSSVIGRVQVRASVLGSSV